MGLGNWESSSSHTNMCFISSGFVVLEKPVSCCFSNSQAWLCWWRSHFHLAFEQGNLMSSMCLLKLDCILNQLGFVLTDFDCIFKYNTQMVMIHLRFYPIEEGNDSMRANLNIFFSFFLSLKLLSGATLWRLLGRFHAQRMVYILLVELYLEMFIYGRSLKNFYRFTIMTFNFLFPFGSSIICFRKIVVENSY